MFPVEIPIFDERRLVETMESMRTWLDHKRFEPAAFRYSYGRSRLVFRIDFSAEAQAIDFAKAFSGEIVGT